MLALLDCPDFGDAVVFSGNGEVLHIVAGGPGGKAFAENYFREAAGHAFFDRYERKERSHSSDEGEESDDDEACDSPSADKSKKKKDSVKGGGILKLSELLKGEKLYKLLDVAEGASQEDIKKAYRDAALKSHPDKMGQVDEAEKKKIEENFVKIQEAHEILSDPAKRQLYDSTLDFDESLPKFKEGKSDEEFYELFGECFRRNARFSSKKPVPDLGDQDTSMADMKKFYDFWYSFSSWRDPLAMAQANDEELQDLEEAECREEKRWMMRENARVAKHYKRAEQERIADLVSMAEKFDPRVRAEKDAKKAARAAEAARKEEEKMAVVRAKQEKERVQREAEEAAAAAEAEKRKQEKAVREAAKAEVKKMRQRLRALHPQMKRFVIFDQLNEVCLQADAASLQKLGDDVAAHLAKGDAGVDAAVQHVYTAIEELGLKPVVPDDEADSTTSGGGEATENDVSFEVEPTIEELEAKEKKRKEQQAKRESEEAALAAERSKAAEKAAEQRKIREEQKKKEEAAAAAKRKQQEKKEAEKAKKEEQKAIKAKEDAEALKIKQREEAKRKSEEQAMKDQQLSAAEREEREEQRVMKLFDDDRLERLATFENATEEELLEQLSASCRADSSLNGSMYLLKIAEATYEDDEQSLDCAAVLLKDLGGVWPLAMTNPKDVKPVPQTRNKAKKVRMQLRLTMQKWLDSRSASEGADAEEDVTDYQRGMVDGLFEWPVWTVEDREAELRSRGVASAVAKDIPAVEVTEDSPQAATPGAAATPKKGKKGAATKGKEDGEDLDALFAEFGVTIDDTKKSKKKKGKN